MTFINSNRNLSRDPKYTLTGNKRKIALNRTDFVFLSAFVTSPTYRIINSWRFLPYYWLLLPLLLFWRPWLWECFFQLSPAHGTFNFYSLTGFHILTKVIIRRPWLWQGLLICSYFSFSLKHMHVCCLTYRIISAWYISAVWLAFTTLAFILWLMTMPTLTGIPIKSSDKWPWLWDGHVYLVFLSLLIMSLIRSLVHISLSLIILWR